MDTNDLLQIAKEIIAKVPSCMAITVARNGEANARVVNPKPLSDTWTVRFATDRRSRKSEEIERSGRLTLPSTIRSRRIVAAPFDGDLARSANQRSVQAIRQLPEGAFEAPHPRAEQHR